MKNLATQLLLAAALLTAGGQATYSQNTAFKALYYSAASHCSAASLETWTCGSPCTLYTNVRRVTPIINDAKGTYGFVGYSTNDNEIVVAFRGSVDIENWITNIDFKMTPYKAINGAQVHEGFYSAYTAVSAKVISAVKTLITIYPTARILITGHSLGGALATFAAVDIRTSISPSTTVNMYTFGSPRTGNQAFTDYVFGLLGTQGYQRLTHYNDVVPHLPPTEFGFNHAGNEVWYSQQGDALLYIECSNSARNPENSRCSDSILATGTAAHLRYLGVTIGD